MQEASGDVVAEVGEAEGDASQVFEPAVDGLGGSVAGMDVVEVGRDVRQAASERAVQGPRLPWRVGGPGVDVVDGLVHHAAHPAPVGFRVAFDDLLVGSPHDLQRPVRRVREQPGDRGALPVGERATGLQQRAPGTVERIACRAAPSGGLPLEVLPTLVVAGEPDDVERVEDFNRVGDGPPDGALVAGERASTVRT